MLAQTTQFHALLLIPGKKSMELLCPGLLCMFISRAMTIGTPKD